MKREIHPETKATLKPLHIQTSRSLHSTNSTIPITVTTINKQPSKWCFAPEEDHKKDIEEGAEKWITL
jgi:ribosomal protein L31